jgi:hypothetical protein
MLLVLVECRFNRRQSSELAFGTMKKAFAFVKCELLFGSDLSEAKAATLQWLVVVGNAHRIVRGSGVADGAEAKDGDLGEE